jgi:DNA-binding NtrC family response regulator
MSLPAILIVDDEPVLRLVIWRMLSRRFPEVHMVAADTVADARQKLTLRQPLLIITDYHLSDGTGSDVLSAAQRIDPALPVVVVSADTSVADMVLHAGARAFVAKPFAMHTLQETVAASLCGASAPR